MHKMTVGFFAPAPMLNLMRMWSTWYSLSMQAARLAWDAQGVMALRSMQIARESLRGGQSETHRMVTEKIAALTEAQAAVATAAVHGSSHRAIKKALGVYKKRVRHNKQRLRRKLGSRTPIVKAR
jgi:DNA-binding NarL/FixJ family response regulator